MVPPVCRLRLLCNLCSDKSHWSSCTVLTGELGVTGKHRSQELSDALLNAVSLDILWFQFGMVANVTVRAHVPAA
jgi:hypothetical protein